MDASDLVLLILGASKSPVRGRTVVQKTAYFSKIRKPKEVEVAFKPHFFGPYSPDVANALSESVAMGYVNEDVDTTPGGHTVYTYSLTSDGRRIADAVAKRESGVHAAIKSISETSSADAHANPNVLSWAAKTHFLLIQNNRPHSTKEAIAMGSDFNWELSPEDIQRGLELLLKLKLVVRVTEKVARARPVGKKASS